jgi:hypothetical protein
MAFSASSSPSLSSHDGPTISLELENSKPIYKGDDIITIEFDANCRTGKITNVTLEVVASAKTCPKETKYIPCSKVDIEAGSQDASFEFGAKLVNGYSSEEVNQFFSHVGGPNYRTMKGIRVLVHKQSLPPNASSIACNIIIEEEDPYGFRREACSSVNVK